MMVILKLFGFAGLVGSLTIVYLFETSSNVTGALRLFHWPALVLTGIGPIMLVILCADLSALGKAVGLLFSATASSRHANIDREGMLLQKLSRSFYTDGIGVFENVKSRGLSMFTRKMLERFSLRMPMPDIKELLVLEKGRLEVRLQACTEVMGLGVRLTPSVGMLGTILGMVNLLAHMSDPSTIGSSMSLALLTTFYGLFFSLTLWTPLQQRLLRVLELEMRGYNQAIRWIEVLEKRKPADYFAEAVDIPVQRAAEGGKR